MGAALLSEEAVVEWGQTVVFWEAAAALGGVGWREVCVIIEMDLNFLIFFGLSF